MVTGYVPLGGNRRKLIQDSCSHIWDEPYLFQVCSDGLLRRCVPAEEGIKIIERCHSSPYGGHYGRSKHTPIYGSVDSSGQQCMKTQENLFRDVACVKDMAISIQGMPCHSSAIFR